MALSETFPWFTNSDKLILSWSNLLYVILAIFTVNCLQILYTILYNVYLHPLRRIPGPQLWIAFPILQQISSLKGNREFKIRGFHEKYGNIVRWAPNHVTFSDAQAWKDIYGHGHAEVPKYFPPGVRDGGTPNIIHSNASDHFRFRRAMLPAFSNAALNQQETLIMVYVNLLKERLHEVASLGQPTDIVEWYTFTTFDLIGDLAYGESFNGLKERKQNEWVGNIQKMMKLYPILVLSSMSPLIMRLLLLAAGPQIKKSKERHEQMSKALAMKRIQNKDQEHRGDFMDLMMRSRGEKHGLTDLELASNSDTLIVAGSETTATLLCGVTYYLLSNPESFATCRDEIRSAFSSADEITFKTATARLPYMMACLEEALRLFPPIPITLSREIPAGQTAVIMGRVFPEKTQVGVHHLATYHSSRNFHLAKEFHPERWLPEAKSNPMSAFFNDNREAHKPFSFGPRDCIGRNLAYHEMRLILAHVLWTFDLTLSESTKNWAEEQNIFALWEKPPLMVDIRARQIEGNT